LNVDFDINRKRGLIVVDMFLTTLLPL